MERKKKEGVHGCIALDLSVSGFKRSAVDHMVEARSRPISGFRMFVRCYACYIHTKNVILSFRVQRSIVIICRTVRLMPSVLT